LIPIPEHLTEGFLPDVDQFHNEAQETWSLEKYLIADIISDPIPGDIPISSTRIHFAIFKRSYVKLSITYYVRSCWFREEDSPIWYELSKDGNYNSSLTPVPIKGFDPLATDPDIRYHGYFFTTAIDRDVFVFENEGSLRIYMPHDCFWFGKITRTAKFAYPEVTTDQYCFDRILEPYHNGVSLIGGTFPDYETGVDCRASINFPYTIVTTGSVIADPVTLTYAQPSVDYSLKLIVAGQPYPADVLTHSWYGVRDSKGNNIPWSKLVAPLNRALFIGLIDENIHLAFKLSTTEIAFHSEYFANITVKNRLNGSIVDISARYAAWITIEYDGDPVYGYLNPAGGGFYVFTIEEIRSAFLFEYAGVQEMSAVGFDPIYTKLYLIFTAQFDNREEVVLVKRLVDVNNNSSPWGLMLDTPQLPSDNNKRITRYFIYLKFDKEDDYEQYREFIVSEDTLIETFQSFITTLDVTGKYLSQTIGFTFTEDKDRYGVENKFLDFTINNGFGYALYANDQLNVYHSAYGRGKIMPDLFYPDNMIEIKGVTSVKKLLNVGNHLGLVTNVKTLLIQTQAVDGSLIFETFDTIPFGIDQREDAVEVQGGAIIKTREGIFYTDGYQIRDKVSEFIDDLVRAGTGKIYYNPVKHELYWIYSTSPVKYIRYRFDEKVWETLHKIQPSGLVDLIIDPEGSLNFITTTSVYLEDVSSLDFNGYLKSGQTDIGHPELDKYLDEIYIDGKGFINVSVYGDGILIGTFNHGGIDRTNKKYFYPLSNRFPFVKLHIEIQSADVTAELYDITLMIDVVPRRQDG
jgi:hypothetical protein